MIWKVQESSLPARQEIVLPKGTAEIIFNLSGNICCTKNGGHEKIEIPPVLINGINISPVSMVKHSHHCFLGIQLHVYALKMLFGLPAIEFTDRVLDAENICPELGELRNHIVSRSCFNDQAAICMQWLYKKIAEAAALFPDNRMLALYYDAEIASFSPRMLSKKLNLCSRQLLRLSRDWLGISPSDFIMYRKYLKSLAAIHTSNQSLTAVAHDAGFYDQSHFIREFRFFTGFSPGEYKKMMSAQPGHLFLPLT